MGIQYLSQLGANAESPAVTEAIRKGVTNLLQSRCLFRVGDPEDAESATRIAMSVYQTMIRADLESRELMGVTPEQSLYLPVWYCLASWIAGGARAPAVLRSDIRVREAPRRCLGATTTCGVLEEKVGPYPEVMPKTYRRDGSSSRRSRTATVRESLPSSPGLLHVGKHVRSSARPPPRAKATSGARRATEARQPPPPPNRVGKRRCQARLARLRRPAPATERATELGGRQAADPGGRRGARGRAQPGAKRARRHGEPRHSAPVATIRRAETRRACANSLPTSTRCSASAHPSRNRPRQSCRDCTTRTTRSSRCSTASASRCPECSAAP